MTDPRNQKLAKILVDYSIKLKAKEKLIISCSSEKGLPLAKEIYKLALLKGAYCYLNLGVVELEYFYFKNATLSQLQSKPEIGLFFANWADKYINIVAEKNDRALANIDPKKILIKSKVNKPIQDIILKKTWVTTYYPTHSMAQTAYLSLEEMEDFYFNACLKDWKKEAEKLVHLKKILDGAKEIKVIGEKTNLSLSFTRRRFQVCDGRYNMPDGEVYAAPLETKTNGKIYFDFPSLRQSKEVISASFIFKNGQVVAFNATKNKDFLSESLNIDAGAKRLGEFALGTNYSINRFMNNTLFDEKIGGTIHLALGSAFPFEEEGGGKNESAIHWDFVKDMRKNGSQVIVDGKIILRDGKIFG